MSPAADRKILEYFRTGYKEVAFRLLVKAHGKRVYNIALFMLRDDMLAEDATQDVFVRIYKGLSGFKGEAKLSTWIYRVVKNVCYDYLRKADRTAVDNLDGLTEMHAARDDPAGPESNYLLEWQRMKVRRALQLLPQNQRLAITLFYFHDKSYEEISRILDQPLGTVKSHIHRGKIHLAKSLAQLKGETR